MRARAAGSISGRSAVVREQVGMPNRVPDESRGSGPCSGRCVCDTPLAPPADPKWPSLKWQGPLAGRPDGRPTLTPWRPRGARGLRTTPRWSGP